MKILVIQTAFIGDVILATAILEKLNRHFPAAQLSFLVQRGQESLFIGHPFLHQVITFDKKLPRAKELRRLLRFVRKQHYDWVINLHRFASSGMLTALSGAKRRSGFRKNPFSPLFTHRISHEISPEGHLHEVDRNQRLIAEWTDDIPAKPRLYPSLKDAEVIPSKINYLCVAPASVWFTKQYPSERWIELIDRLPKEMEIHLLGGPADMALCSSIHLAARHPRIRNRTGELTLLQSAALMSGAHMNYVNDSAPLHLASAMNAAVTAVFCSTVPAFGFGPLSSNSRTVEVSEILPCRPCGLHGKRECPLGHFRCSHISVEQILGES